MMSEGAAQSENFGRTGGTPSLDDDRASNGYAVDRSRGSNETGDDDGYSSELSHSSQQRRNQTLGSVDSEALLTLSADEDSRFSRGQSQSAERDYSDYSDYTPSSLLLSPSELSSITEDSTVVHRILQVWKRIELPVVGTAIVLAGIRVAKMISRAPETVVLSTCVLERSSDAMPELPYQLSSFPTWVHAARASLPVLVEKPVIALLRWSKVVPPALAVNHSSMQAAVPHDSSTSASWLSFGPMVPPAAFLPLFTLAVLKAASLLSHRRISLNHPFSIPQHELDEDLEESPVPPVSAGGRSDDDANILGDAVEPSSAFKAPPLLSSTGRHSRDFLHHTPKGRTVSPMDLSNKSGAVAPSPIVSAPSSSRRFVGSVITALVGNPTVEEVNRVVVASATYGCAKILLPQSAQHLDHVALPPSVSAEYSSNVLDATLEVANRRGMQLISVFESQSVSGAVHLNDFHHPFNCLYVFSAAEGVDPAELSARTDAAVFVFENPSNSGIPINVCFSQRANDVSLRDDKSRLTVA